MQAYDGSYPTPSVQRPGEEELPPGALPLERCCRLVEDMAPRCGCQEACSTSA